MKFAIVLTIDKEAVSKSALIHSLSQKINESIQSKEYGDGLHEYLLSLIVINPPVGFEHLHKPFKPKFTDYKSIINRYTDEKVEIVKQYHYSIKIDGDAYIYFLKANEIESRNFIASKILESLKNLELLPKKIQYFDKERFTSDLRTILNEKNF